MNDDVELLIDSEGNKYYVLKNSNLNIYDERVEFLYEDFKELNNKVYYKNKLLHREDGGPAIEHSSGTKEWYKNGELHRDDGPAIEAENEGKEWYIDGIRHRDDGPALEYKCGNKYWYKNGLIHREDGPAIQFFGDDYWYKNGLIHREDGPAVECKGGSKEYWLNGEEIPEDKFHFQKELREELIRNRKNINKRNKI